MALWQNKNLHLREARPKRSVTPQAGSSGKVFLSPQVDDTELRSLISQAGIKCGTFEPKKAPGGVSPDASHQGVIASISPSKLVLSYQSFVDMLAVGADTALVLLDELQDPHNVGAVIRSAAAFGISGVLIPEHNQSQVTGAVVKVSAGMVFRVPLVSVGNVNTVLRDLKDRGFWIYGLEGDVRTILQKKNLTRRLCLSWAMRQRVFA